MHRIFMHTHNHIVLIYLLSTFDSTRCLAKPHSGHQILLERKQQASKKNVYVRFMLYTTEYSYLPENGEFYAILSSSSYIPKRFRQQILITHSFSFALFSWASYVLVCSMRTISRVANKMFERYLALLTKCSNETRAFHRLKSMFEQRSIVIYEPAIRLKSQMKFAIKTYRFYADTNQTDCVDFSLWFAIPSRSLDSVWKNKLRNDYYSSNEKRKIKQICSIETFFD